jgi:hypothetical protein
VSPRRVVEEFERLRTIVFELAGSIGVAEYFRILRECGAARPQDFKTSQNARVCAKRVCEWIEELKAGDAKPPEAEPQASVAPAVVHGTGVHTGEAHAQ